MYGTIGLNEPIFFIGMGRSGTTIIFEALARHRDLAWLSNYSKWLPALPWANALVPLLCSVGLRGNKKQYGRVFPGNRFLPQPDEAYEFWDYFTQQNFSRSYLYGIEPSRQDIDRIHRAVKSVMRWQGKARFAAKITGPGRVAYLSSIFPGARFVHVIRDGRAVVESLLRQNFWIQKGGLEKPFWEGTPAEILEEMQQADNTPEALAAIQWRYVVQSIKNDLASLSDKQCMEVRYEDFVTDPAGLMSSVCRFVGLTAQDEVLLSNNGRDAGIKNMNEKWRTSDEERLKTITRHMQPVLGELGYE